MFKLNLLPKFEIERIEKDGVRYYITPDGVFKSVTTRLGEYYGDDFLVTWRERVGEKEADRISSAARNGGSKLHACMENFLLNQPISQFHSLDRMRFESVKRKLTKHISEVNGVENFLWSKSLQTAGAADGIVTWDNKKTIVDLKTSKKYKNEKYIESYFTQATAYGIMANERYNIGIEKIVILFSLQDFSCYFFEKNLTDYQEKVFEIFK